MKKLTDFRNLEEKMASYDQEAYDAMDKACVYLNEVGEDKLHKSLQKVMVNIRNGKYRNK